MNKHIIINVGRQLGSGGHLIGKMLAKDLGIAFYDKELLNLAAQESGFDVRFFERNDEHKGFLKNLLGMFVPFHVSNDPFTNQLSEETLFKFQSDAIRKVASTTSCVFVGRCADYILRDFKECVNIFITANPEDRIERVQQQHGLSEEEARKKIAYMDTERASYYNFYTTKKWGHSGSYDLCLNSSILGIEGTVEIIKAFIEKRMRP